MEDPFLRMKLYTLSGNVAMQTGSIPQVFSLFSFRFFSFYISLSVSFFLPPQADGLFRSAVSVINEIPTFQSILFQSFHSLFRS
jgi:hypothetical protein